MCIRDRYITACRAKKLICVSSSIPNEFRFVKGKKEKFVTLPNVIDAQEIEKKSLEFTCGQKYELGSVSYTHLVKDTRDV